MEEHLKNRGRDSDILGCESLMNKSKQHVVHIWSAACCRLHFGWSIEKTVRIFWEAGTPSLRELLSSWLLGVTAPTASGQITAEQVVKLAVEHIRAVLPAWPKLGDSDVMRVTAYVVTASELHSAWLNAQALPRISGCRNVSSNVAGHLLLAVNFALQDMNIADQDMSLTKPSARNR